MKIEIANAALVDSKRLNYYIDYLYERKHRDGFLYRDCARLVKSARNTFAACMLACGDAMLQCHIFCCGSHRLVIFRIQ